MPAFIKTPADEKRWSKAKSAANKTLSESAGDSYWALVNSIYQKMTKSVEDIEAIETVLTKARRKLSDEYDPNEQSEGENLEDEGFREFDPDEEDASGEDWLNQNDPERVKEERDGSKEEDPYYHEYAPDEDQDAHQKDVAEAEPDDEESGGATDAPMPVRSPEDPVQVSAGQEGDKPQQQAQQEVAPKKEGMFPQPSREEIADMRQYTRPWEQRARDSIRLRAEPSKNPVLHHQGQILEARNASHKDRQSAYDAMQGAADYQNADPITQMEMDAKFHDDWNQKNPEHITNAMRAHEQAHSKGLQAKDVHAAAKDEQIRHVLGGGAQAETPMSVEEAMQHAGGEKTEEGTTGAMVQDPASSFAAGNKEFINQYAKEYGNKSKKPKQVEEMMQYDPDSQKDVERILGEHPAMKDPKNKQKVDQFFQKYYPLVGISASKVMNKLGLDQKRGDIDLGMLHEAGMHGLFQAINDYNHDHPSKAGFATHAGNKIRGLMQTALRGQDQIPAELRQGAKKFQQAQAPKVQAPKPDIKGMISSHPAANDIMDRMKRAGTARAVHGVKKPPQGGSENV